MEIRTIVEVRIGAPAERVWRALREPQEIRRWFGWEHGGLDEEVEHIFLAGVEELAPGKQLRFKSVDTTFTVDDHGTHSVLRVTKRDRHEDPGYDEIEEGWVSFLQQLRFGLEKHAGEERRTLFLSNPPRTPIERAKIARSGRPAFGSFAALAQVPVGERYQLTAADALDGELWFRSAHQLGVTFEQDAGLLVLGRPPDQAHGTGIVTVFGLDEAAFTALRERWTAWWRGENG
ncbi:MAG: SRPBCC domain-containing protein [Polyangiales bacterium]